MADQKLNFELNRADDEQWTVLCWLVTKQVK